MSKFGKIGLLTAVVVAMTSLASAQINGVSGAQPITLNASLAESLTMSLSAASVNFTLTPGLAANPGSNTVTATSSWVLKPGRQAVNLYAWFNDPAIALLHQDPTAIAPFVDIPSSAVEISMSTGGAGNQALSTSEAMAAGFGPAGAGKLLLNIPINGGNKVVTGRTDTMTFNINLSSLPLALLPADNYVGTVNIQVQAIN